MQKLNKKQKAVLKSLAIRGQFDEFVEVSAKEYLTADEYKDLGIPSDKLILVDTIACLRLPRYSMVVDLEKCIVGSDLNAYRKMKTFMENIDEQD